MDIKNKIMNTSFQCEKYIYYKKLGYSEEASCVLAYFTYGTTPLSSFVASFGDEDVLRKIYAWLLEHSEEEAEGILHGPRDGGFLYAAAAPQSTGGVVTTASSAKKGLFGAVTNASQSLFKSRTSAVRTKNAAPEAMMRTAVTLDACAMEEPEMPFTMEEISTDSYEKIEEKDSKNVFTAPTSTFRMTTNTASMGVILNQIRNKRNTSISQVRIEEILNYFNYVSKKPEKDVFEINTELLDKGKNKKMLYINVQAKEEIKDHQNIILLLDVSGSMHGNNVTTQEAIATIVSKLKTGDVFSLVTYSTNDATIFDSYKIKNEEDKEYIMGRVLGLVIEGCTYGSAGIETAYKIGAKNYDKDWNNQVVLITDGDLNFGVTKKDGLQSLIEKEKKKNLFLSVIGTGLWNFKDDKLEVLCKYGNGTYCAVNNIYDVDESINKNYSSLTNVVAKDVKAQIEFNPKYVKEYRLLGYENRTLAHEDFTNDKVVSEPYGSGGHGVALYELVMNDGEVKSELKYQAPVVSDSDELCTIKVRYKDPLGDSSFEIEKIVKLEDTETDNAKLAYLLYCLSEKLRKSDKLDEFDENFLSSFIKDCAYEKYSELNGDRLKLFIDYYNNI